MPRYGVPLTPDEVANLDARFTDDAVLRRLHQYGMLHPDEWAGAYTDLTRSMSFVVLVTAGAERHRQVLTTMLPATVRLDVRTVEWTKDDLEHFAYGLEQEHGWDQVLAARFLTSGVRTIENRVYLKYEGSPDDAETIADWYGQPAWLVVDWVGGLPWTGPRADLVIDVVDGAGRAVPNVECDPTPDDRSVHVVADTRYVTDANGRCAARQLPAVPYTVTLERQGNGDVFILLKTIHVDLQPGMDPLRVIVDPDR